MNELEARFGMLIETLIFVGISSFIGWIIAVVYTKITNKTFDDLPNRYWEFFILGGFILWIVVIQLLT